MLRNRIVYFLVLLLLVLFRIAYTGYAAGLMLVLALILPIFSWLISLPGALCTYITLSVPDQVIRGSEASVTLNLRQSRFFATGTVRGKLKMHCGVTGATSYTRLKGVYGGFPIDTAHCCVFELSLKRFRVMDLLGLIPMPTHQPAMSEVTVLPFPEEPPEHPDWTAGASLVAKPFSGAENPYDLREYRTGDTLRAIHWKKSAALGKTVVRDTLEPAVRVATIWLDWPENPHGRDVALDQLSWCLIYLKQNNAGLLLKWLDKRGREQSLYAPAGEVDGIMPRMLSQPAGRRVPASAISPREILLSQDLEGGSPI